MRLLLPCVCLCIVCLSPAQTVRMQLKFPKGKVDRMTTTTSMIQSMSMPGSPKMNMNINQSMTLLSRVANSGPSGATVALTYEDIKSTTSMNGKAVNSSSDVAKLVKGKTITLQFAANGTIQRVDGVQELLSKSFTSLPPQMQAGMKQMFSEQSVRDMWSMAFGNFPNKPVKVGQGWTSKLSFGQAPFRMGLNLNMHLLGVERRQGHQVARVGTTGTGSLDMAGLVGKGMKMKTDRFSITGTTYFDLDRGWMSDQTMKMLIQGSMTIPAQGKTQSMAFTMNITTSSKIAPVK